MIAGIGVLMIVLGNCCAIGLGVDIARELSNEALTAGVISCVVFNVTGVVLVRP